MKKNDKLIVILGVIILILSSIGIYYWVPEGLESKTVSIKELENIAGVLAAGPDAIIASDSNPFYPLIATPLAINYDSEEIQTVKPLYVMNLEDPSRAVERAMNEQISMYHVDLIIDDTKSEKQWSLELAKEYWETSDAALIIKNDEIGYGLGLIATPIASYLTIPVIVTDEIDSDVRLVLTELGVKYSIICGDLEGFGDFIKFTDVDELVDFSADFVEQKFGNIDYISLANLKDSWLPEVLASEEYHFGPVTVPTTAFTQLVNVIKNSGKSPVEVGTFTIPKDYKYALVKFEGINLDIEDVEEFGDAIGFSIGSNLPDLPAQLEKFEIYTGGTDKGGVPVRDENGNIIEDRVYSETVLYDRGGVEYTIKATGSFHIKKEGKAIANIIIEKLENPVYPLMKGLSSLAPYLTAYHKGIVFAKPEFAFTADDDVINDKGETSPGFYLPRRNIDLVKISNNHIIEEIHNPLNELLAKLAKISLDDDRDIERLREHYKDEPINIAIVGGSVVLPQYIYDNINQPVDYELCNYWYGVGTPSDVIYGNIDPIPDDWTNLANDKYSEYPFQENIVGRITGWDVQDASALIARSVFYDYIVNGLEDWKDNFGLLMGGGVDFRKPPLRYLIFGQILGIVKRGEPLKLSTGATEIFGERTVEQIAKPMGFEVTQAWEEAAMKEGFSDESLNKLKKLNLLTKLTFRTHLVKSLVGEGNVKGGEIMESSNFLWVNAHGSQHGFATDATRLVSSGLGGIFIRKILEQILPIFHGGFMGPGGGLRDVGYYHTRNVEGMSFGPSFMWLESCICCKMDGLYPHETVGQAMLHAGVTSLIGGTTTTNVAGGYLEPKKGAYDTGISVLRAYINAKRDAKKGIYPEPHFGYRLYTDLCNDLKNNDVSIGMAFRNAKNVYLEGDADWELWWSPPLVTTGDLLLDLDMVEKFQETSSGGLGLMMEHKYTTYQEYMLFGDPALNLYEPINEG